MLFIDSLMKCRTCRSERMCGTWLFITVPMSRQIQFPHVICQSIKLSQTRSNDWFDQLLTIIYIMTKDNDDETLSKKRIEVLRRLIDWEICGLLSNAIVFCLTNPSSMKLFTINKEICWIRTIQRNSIFSLPMLKRKHGMIQSKPYIQCNRKNVMM